MITLNQIVSSFQQIIGWPYASPGSNDQNGIDCSGAFVRAYKQYGFSIYHGSNRIIRVYCHDVFTIQGQSQLQVGMAVFKARSDLNNMSDAYKPGGQYYDPSLPYDYYHIGLVTSINPFQIIHATTPVAKMDTTLSNWTTAGYLNQVDYGSIPTPEPAPSQAVTAATSGSSVNLRSGPSKSAGILTRVPLDVTVDVLFVYDDTWWQVRYQGTTGYMMQEFLSTDAPGSDQVPDQAITVADSGSTVNLRSGPSKSYSVLVRVPLGAVVEVLSAYDNSWWQVRYQSTTGYMMQEFLQAAD